MLLKKKILPALLACSLGVSSYVALPGGPALAAGAGEEEPGELAREGMERMLRAIELMIEMIPQYELPEVMEKRSTRREPKLRTPLPLPGVSPASKAEAKALIHRSLRNRRT
jgi:hypothetical protein